MNIQLKKHLQNLRLYDTPPTIFRYANSILITLIALALSAVFWDFINESPFLFFIAGVALSAWYGGLGPGILSTILSILVVDYFLLEPIYVVFTDESELLQFLIFSFVAVLINWIESNRRTSVETLHQANAQLQAIVDGVSDGITAQNEKGDILFANEAAAQIAGMESKSRMMGMAIGDIQRRYELYDVAGNRMPYSELPRNRVFTEKRKARAIFRQRWTDTGQEIWVSLSSAPVFDRAGNIVMAVNVFRDISEQYKINKERAQLAAIVDNSEDAIIGKSLDYLVTTWNPGAESLYGYRSDEIVGKPVTTLFAEDVKEHDLKLLDRVRDGDRVQNFETKRVRKDGVVLDISLTISPIRDENGNVTGFSAIERDITAHKRHEAEITRLTLLTQAQHNRLTNIVASVPGMVYESTIMPDSGRQRMDFMSDYVESLFGYSLDEWKENENLWEKIVLEEDWESIGKQAEKIYAAKEAGIIGFRGRTKSGQVMHLESHTLFIDNDDGTVKSRGVIMDVTERKHFEEMLKEYTEDLRRSNEELEQFAYVASHDLQEPLRMVTSYLQLIESRYKENLDDDAKIFIDFAVDGASRMKQLINDLLTYSRVQRNKDEIGTISMDMALSQALHNLKMSIEESNATIVHDTLPEVFANERQMVQLFQNLIGNSLKFRGEESPQVTVSARQKGDLWEFAVKDNGIGIEAEHRDRIFAIFQRLHTREKYSGTGIGLAICRKIVDKHGGEIWVESEPGNGTTFFFTIPTKKKRRQLHGTH